MTTPSYVYIRPRLPMEIIAAAFTLIMTLMAAINAGEPNDDPAKAPPQAYLLPLEIEKIQNTATDELLKLRPDLKADDLKISQLMYILTPDPDFAIEQKKDGSEKKIYLSSNYQQLSVSFVILHTKHAGKEGDRPTIEHDTISVNFPNARNNKFSVSKGTDTEYR